MSVSKRMLGVVERKNRGAICWRECEEYLKSIQFAEANEYCSYVHGDSSARGRE